MHNKSVPVEVKVSFSAADKTKEISVSLDPGISDEYAEIILEDVSRILARDFLAYLKDLR